MLGILSNTFHLAARQPSSADTGHGPTHSDMLDRHERRKLSQRLHGIAHEKRF